MRDGVTIDPLAVRVECVDDLEALATYRGQWDQLALSASADAAQTFDYAAAGWRARGPEAERLSVLLAFRGERLLGVWPLQIVRRGRLKAACPLGSGSCEEYSDPLIAGDPAARGAVAAALHAAAVGLADLLEAYNLAEGSPLRTILLGERRIQHVDAMRSPVVALAQAGGWDAWAAGKSKSFRAKLKQDRKRLAQLGPIAFRQVEPGQAQSFCAWLFEEKRRYLDRQGLVSDWVRRPEPQAFFADLMGREGSGVLGFSLEVGGRRAAGAICLVDRRSAVEYFVTTYDPAFEEGSPGKLLIEDIVRWCIDRRLDFDFRLTRESYKLRWADRDVAYFTHIVACAAPAVPRVIRRRLQAWLADARHGLKQRLLKVLKRPA